ncbi:MAG: retroviral-like aspartic protease family protein [Anaerolineae bacterium]|nr:retroviral-like aspartic protease family protein [Anaerolineae bacterium]
MTEVPATRVRRAGRVLLAVLLLLALVGCSRLSRQQQEEMVVRLQVVEGPGGSVLALVPVTIAGQGPFPFALDTGASQSVVDLDIKARTNLPEVGRTREVTGILGTGEAVLVQVDDWQADEVVLPRVRAIALDLPKPAEGEGLAGLLGSDVLSTFGAITVDYERQVLILRPAR